MKLEASSPLMLERFELKFLIPHKMISDIAEYVESYCQLDPYCNDEGWYTINTLYVDSPKNTFLKRRENGNSTRFNMRVRSYGDKPKAPYFAEIKYKQDGIVKKFRTKLSEEMWQKDFVGPEGLFSGDLSGVKNDNYDHFQRLATLYNVEPKVFTQYKRKAYMSLVDDYARVTFDNDLRCEPSEIFNLDPSNYELTHYDNSTLFPEGADTILELKCTTKVPLWMIDLIKYFNLSRTRFSKFANSYNEIHSLNPHSLTGADRNFFDVLSYRN